MSSVEGWASLDELLDPDEMAALPAGVDASERISGAPEADSITLRSCCAHYCGQARKGCECVCCYCDSWEGCTSA